MREARGEALSNSGTAAAPGSEPGSKPGCGRYDRNAVDLLGQLRKIVKGRSPSGGQPVALQPETVTAPRTASSAWVKPSRAWQRMNDYWTEGESVSVLDLGSTSNANIQYFCKIGGRFQQEDLLHELPGPDGAPGDGQEYLVKNLLLPAASLDAVLLWDRLDYVPQDLIVPLAERLTGALRPGGTLLALFHGHESGPEPVFHQYHIRDRELLEWRPFPPRPIQQVFQVRHVEKLFASFQSIHFFLGHDGMREVLMVR